jgi:TRAP-type mannitol/chloroaromatic compound transport system permease small subunit
MSLIRTFIRFVDKLNYWVARIVSWTVVLIMLATAYEVIRRYVFNSPTQWVFEFNYLVHGMYFMLMGAYVLAVRGHVNVDIFYARFSLRGRAILDCITSPLFFFFIIMMLYHGYGFAMKSISFRETLSSAWAPPIYPFKAVIPVAAVLILLQGLSKLIQDVHIVFTGREIDL